MKEVQKIMAKIELENSSEKLGGPGAIVELDESKFGKRKYNRGHRVEGVCVFGMVERTPRRAIRLFEVEKRDARTLCKLVKENVAQGTAIYTDKWKGYTALNTLGFNHQTVNHSENFKDPNTGVHTNTIEGNWAGIKGLCTSGFKRLKWISFYLKLYTLKRLYENDLFYIILDKLINDF